MALRMVDLASLIDPGPRPPVPPRPLDAGRRIYAIGDVHGCADRLAALHADIAADLAARPVASPAIVHLGDYIDRGPRSAEALALGAAPRVAGAPNHPLLGNHEDMMLAALAGDRAMQEAWLANGGDSTIESFGLDPATPFAALRDDLQARAGPALARLQLCHDAGPYMFVHAGIRPGVARAQQRRRDLLWIRDRFLDSPADHGVIVVHGHTPAETVEIRANRIGLDTGAVFGGRLTCAVLEAAQIGFLSR